MSSYIRTRTEFAVNSFSFGSQVAASVSTFADGGFDAGNDVLNGGAGADRLTGGLGKDEFVFAAVGESTPAARDVITDFSRSQSDKISLSGIDANSVLAGNQAFAFIGAAAFSGAAGQLRFEQVGGNTFVSGDVNGDRVADFQIELTGPITPVASDFVL